MSDGKRDDFGFETTTDEVLEGLDLEGRLALVTGGSSGLGAETARALASKGADVIITARDQAKGEQVAAEIRASTGREVGVESLELGSLEDVRAFAARFLEAHDRLDLLINNAGVMACPEGRTQDGFERQLGTNHVGHFLLTGLLAPALVRAAPSRVVNLSSSGHQIAPVDFDDPWFERRDYEKWTSYGQSKTANVQFTVGLEERLGPKGVHAYAVHPGAIVTELGRHMTEEDMARMRQGLESGAFQLKSVESGAATSVYAATAPELEGRGGVFLADCGICEVDDEAHSQTVVRSYALDPANAERLWSLSEDWVGQPMPVLD